MAESNSASTILPQKLFRLCCLIFLLVFGGVFVGAVLRGHLSVLLILPAALLGAGFWCAAHFLFPLAQRMGAKSYALLFGGGLGLLLLLQLGTGFALLNDNWTAPFDTEAVYRTAVQLAQGVRPADYNDYFVCSDGNFFCMLLLFWWYRLVFLLGGSMSPVWGMVLNALLLWLAPVFLCCTARLLWGQVGGAGSLLLCFFFLPYYIFVPFLYTDPMAAPFVAVCLYTAVSLFQKWQSLDRRGRALRLLLLGALLGLAFLSKGNGIVLLPALLLALLFGCRAKGHSAKRWLCAAALVLAAFFAVVCGIKAYERGSGILDFSGYDAYHMPLTHWIMMGLENDGAYNSESFAYSGRYPTLATRKAAIAERLQSNAATLFKNPAALLWLMDTKAETCWLDGLYSSPAMAAMSPVSATPESGLGAWFFPGGAQYPAVSAFGQSFYLMLWGGALLFAFRLLRGRVPAAAPNRFAAYFALFALLGDFAFLCLWEANQRYTFSFSCFLLLLFLAQIFTDFSARSAASQSIIKEDLTLGQQQHS